MSETAYYLAGFLVVGLLLLPYGIYRIYRIKQGEPVAWMDSTGDVFNHISEYATKEDIDSLIPLYLAAPVAKNYVHVATVKSIKQATGRGRKSYVVSGGAESPYHNLPNDTKLFALIKAAPKEMK